MLIRTTTRRVAVMSLASALSLCACETTEPPDAPDAAPTPDAPATTDAANPDAPGPDAGGPCPDGILFTGGYEDWDSTLTSFDGVEFAEVRQVDDPANSDTTAPNGRVVMCLPAARTAVDFIHADYLDLRYTAWPESTRIPFAVRGLKPVRADDLFAQELGLTRDLLAAQVTISVRDDVTGDPVSGAIVALGNSHAGAYTADGVGVHGPGDTLVDSPFILFANVAIDGGTTTVQVTPPAGIDCQGPADIDLVAGAMAAADFACSSP